MEVAVAALPTRHRVAGLRIHLHVEPEQVVATFEPVLRRLVEEELSVLALPIRRPCMSVKAATTVSIAPFATSLRSSSSVSIDLRLYCACSPNPLRHVSGPTARRGSSRSAAGS